MHPVAEISQKTNSNVKRLDNHRVFRAEAVEAYMTRRAGDPWIAGMRLQGWMIAALTIAAAAAVALLLLGGR